MKPDRIIPKWAFALLTMSFAALLLLLLWLACYAQPAKDDYFSIALFQNKNVAQSLSAQYQLSNGRLVSAFFMRFSPLQFHSFEGYKIVCAGFVLLFTLCTFLFLNKKLNKLHLADRAAIFFAAYLVFHAALGSFAEFYYWLPAVSCYSIGTLLFIALLALMPGIVSRQSGYVQLVAAGLICFLLPLCNEVGTIMALTVAAIYWVNSRNKNPEKGNFIFLLLMIAAGTIVAALSPGNAARFATSHYPRNIILIAGAGIYTTLADLLRFLFYGLPAAFLAWTLFKRKYELHTNKRKLIQMMGVILLLWLLGETATCYALGGLPALRIRNSFLLFAWIIVPTAISLCSSLEKRMEDQPQNRSAIGLTTAWIFSMMLVLNGPVLKAAEDLIAGVPQRYDRQMMRVYKEAASGNELFKKVSVVNEIPLSLYIEQPLIMPEDTSGWPYFNVYMALYFGHERLYADTLARVPQPDAALREWLMNYRK